MTDEAILARQSFAAPSVDSADPPSSNPDVPDRRARDYEHRPNLDLVLAERKFGGSEEAQRRTLDAQHRLAHNE